MKTPFTIKFQKDIHETSNIVLLESFKENFILSKCDFVDIINNNELIVENEMMSFISRLRFNLWIGIEHARISIIEDKTRNTKTIKYFVDYTWLISTYFISFIAWTIVVLLNIGKDEFLYLAYFLIALFIFALIFSLSITFLRHRSIFNNTIKYGASYIRRYEWNSILEKKTDIELMEIINGKRHLPKSVLILAEKELEKRNSNSQHEIKN